MKEDQSRLNTSSSVYQKSQMVTTRRSSNMRSQSYSEVDIQQKSVALSRAKAYLKELHSSAQN